MPDDAPLFFPADFFLIRAASFPIEDFFSLVKERDPAKILVEKWLKDPCFRQALAVSSPSLSKQLRKGKIDQEILLSVFKYFSRTTSRATPYGLLSFVTWGEKGESVSSKLNLKSLVKRARPDMGWTQKYIEKIFQDDSEFLSLEVETNPMVLEKTGQYSVDYFLDKSDQMAASIKKNQLTALIFTSSRSPLKLKELVNIIQTHFPRAQIEKILETLKLLLEQQFLWYTLYPKLNAESPFQELLTKVPKKYAKELEEIEIKITHYNTTGFAEGEDDLYQLADTMAEKAKSLRFPLQVDFGIPSKQLILPQKVLETVAKGGEILWKLSQLQAKQSSLGGYHSRFLEKYGQRRLVPLLDLLDSTKGLGPLQSKTPEETTSYRNTTSTVYQEWLSGALATALWTQQKEIVLNDSLFSQFDQKMDKEHANTSMDLFFEICADSPQDLDRENYLICMKGILNRGGATFGRFLHLLDPVLTKKLREFTAQESKLEKDVLTFESFYLPQSSDIQNVAISPPLRPNVLDLLPGGTSTLSLGQIYVGATREFLYLTNAQGDLELRFTSTNVLVDSQAPQPIQFLRKVSQERVQETNLWSWETSLLSPFFPRVRYQNIILSAARWEVTLLLIRAKQTESLEEIAKKLSAWMDQFDLPEYVYITERDNKLLINRNLEIHLKIATSYLRKHKKIVFLEKIGQQKGEWVKGDKPHCVEYVLPLLKNPVYARKERTSPTIAYENLSISDRWKLPGSEWLYYKFFLPASSHLTFLQGHLAPFASQLAEENLIHQWFFIRFQENGTHQIRFRARIHQTLSLPTVFQRLHQFSQNLLTISLIQDVSICSYEREVERYGGLTSVDLCEKLFCVDSHLVLELLKFESPELPLHLIGTISVLDMLQHLFSDEEKVLRFIRSTEIIKKELNGYRDQKKTIERGFGAIFGPIGERRAEVLRELRDLPSLVLSLIHMHCNRLCGINPNLENKIKAFSIHHLENSLRTETYSQGTSKKWMT